MNARCWYHYGLSKLVRYWSALVLRTGSRLHGFGENGQRKWPVPLETGLFQQSAENTELDDYSLLLLCSRKQDFVLLMTQGCT